MPNDPIALEDLAAKAYADLRTRITAEKAAADAAKPTRVAQGETFWKTKVGALLYDTMQVNQDVLSATEIELVYNGYKWRITVDTTDATKGWLHHNSDGEWVLQNNTAQPFAALATLL